MALWLCAEGACFQQKVGTYCLLHMEMLSQSEPMLEPHIVQTISNRGVVFLLSDQ